MQVEVLNLSSAQILSEYINKNHDDISELVTDIQKLAELISSAMAEINGKLSQIELIENRVTKLEDVIEQLKSTGARYNSSIVYNS